MTSACEVPVRRARGRLASTAERAAARAARRGRSLSDRAKAGKETRCIAEASAVGNEKSQARHRVEAGRCRPRHRGHQGDEAEAAGKGQQLQQACPDAELGQGADGGQVEGDAGPGTGQPAGRKQAGPGGDWNRTAEAEGAQPGERAGEGEGVEGEGLGGLDHGNPPKAQVPLEQDHRHRPQRVERYGKGRDRDHRNRFAPHARGRQRRESHRHGRRGKGGTGDQQEARDGAPLPRRRVLGLANQRRAEPNPAGNLSDALHRRGDRKQAVVGRREQPGKDQRHPDGEQLQDEGAADQDADASSGGDAQRWLRLLAHG